MVWASGSAWQPYFMISMLVQQEHGACLFMLRAGSNFSNVSISHRPPVDIRSELDFDYRIKDRVFERGI